MTCATQSGSCAVRFGAPVVPPDSNICGTGGGEPYPRGYQILDRHIAQLVEQVGKQPQIREGLDVGQRVEVQRLGGAQPKRRARVFAEVPGDRGAQIGLGVVNGYRSRDVQQRKIDIGHAIDPVACPSGQAIGWRSAGHTWPER